MDTLNQDEQPTAPPAPADFEPVDPNVIPPSFNPEAMQQVPVAQPEPIDDYNTGNMYGSNITQNIPSQAIQPNITPYGTSNEGQSSTYNIPQDNIPQDIPPPDYESTMAKKKQQSNITQPLISNVLKISHHLIMNQQW
eukprot:CAMPEP_0201594426 /NCGR_PEP_ID=MMETSP0190_2-20130828/191748_1 /ASSEMBLY_ACC=CAM_ASM_000263 /TAXON_ID=37353 /ORGANISM="Rosalina sp." /LENGTH=137 /DNA_ID=CAMNT_0048054037 /DNA_START=29 /DNA_END=439 /DNA_ORIENTATION=+